MSLIGLRGGWCSDDGWFHISYLKKKKKERNIKVHHVLDQKGGGGVSVKQNKNKKDGEEK